MALAIMVVFGVSTEASACMLGGRFNFRVFGKADLILNARIIGYEIKKFEHVPGNGVSPALGLIQFEVVDPKSAPSAKEHGINLLHPRGIRGKFKAYLIGAPRGLPKVWMDRPHVIVALTVYPTPDGMPGVFVVEGDTCSGPAIVEDSVENMLRVSQVRDDFRNWLYAHPDD
jgi:hypothetical protein